MKQGEVVYADDEFVYYQGQRHTDGYVDNRNGTQEDRSEVEGDVEPNYSSATKAQGDSI